MMSTPAEMRVASVLETRASAILCTTSPMRIGILSLKRSHTWRPRSVRFRRRKAKIIAPIAGKMTNHQWRNASGLYLMLALPAILLAITIAARLGPGLTSAMIAAGLVGLPSYARLARGATLAIKRREFVEAARSTGASQSRIMARHILPNILTPLIVQATIGVGNAILLVSALGYLGIGAQQPTPEWGRMLSDAQRYILDATYIGIFPGVAIALTVIGFNLAGDGLRDTLSPTTHRSGWVLGLGSWVLGLGSWVLGLGSWERW